MHVKMSIRLLIAMGYLTKYLREIPYPHLLFLLVVGPARHAYIRYLNQL